MRRTFLKSKIHGATLTAAKLEYEGSVRVDRALLDAAGIRPFERVQVLNESNGARLETYAIEAPEGSGEVALNGPAARLGYPGDRVILISYVDLEEEELESHRPVVVEVDGGNRPVGPRLRSESGG